MGGPKLKTGLRPLFKRKIKNDFDYLHFFYVLIAYCLLRFLHIPNLQERYETLMDKYQDKHVKISEASSSLVTKGRSFLDKTLSAALDSFDNLFCRRCLVVSTSLPALSVTLKMLLLMRCVGIHRYLTVASMVVLKA